MSLLQITLTIFGIAFAGGIGAIWQAKTAARKVAADTRIIEQKVGPEVADLTADALGKVIGHLSTRQDDLEAEVSDVRYRLDRTERALRTWSQWAHDIRARWPDLRRSEAPPELPDIPKYHEAFSSPGASQK